MRPEISINGSIFRFVIVLEEKTNNKRIPLPEPRFKPLNQSKSQMQGYLTISSVQPSNKQTTSNLLPELIGQKAVQTVFVTRMVQTQ